MALRDDVALVCAVIDLTLHGALPYTDVEYTTKQGRALAELVTRLRVRLYDSERQHANAAALREEIEGQRAANDCLTRENERLRARLEVSDD